MRFISRQTYEAARMWVLRVGFWVYVILLVLFVLWDIYELYRVTHTWQISRPRLVGVMVENGALGVAYLWALYVYYRIQRKSARRESLLYRMRESWHKGQKNLCDQLEHLQSQARQKDKQIYEYEKELASLKGAMADVVRRGGAKASADGGAEETDSARPM